jgi:hypothetical protein
VNFQAYRPYLLTDRLLKARAPARRGGPVLFMGCGFYLFYVCARALGYIMLIELTLMWDVLVISMFACVWAGWATWRGSYLLTRWTVRKVRARREATA